MPTSRISLDVSQYVRVNTGLNPLIIESFNGDIKVCVTENQPALTNGAYHTVNNRDRLPLPHLDTNVWVLAEAEGVQASITELTGGGYNGAYLANVARGLVPGHRLIHKFGHGSVGTNPTPITTSGFWRTPSSPVALEFVSDNATDTGGGLGASKIIVQGIDVNWNETLEEITTNGLTPVSIPTSLMRLHRWYVSESGTYADETSVSHAGTLTIQVSGGGDVWDTIDGTLPFAAQSEIAVATIPAGYSAYILSKNLFTDTNKTADIYFMQRPNADDVVAPYTGARRMIERDIGLSGGYTISYASPKGPYVGPCDIGFMGKVDSGTADVSIDYEILLIQDGY